MMMMMMKLRPQVEWMASLVKDRAIHELHRQRLYYLRSAIGRNYTAQHRAALLMTTRGLTCLGTLIAKYYGVAWLVFVIGVRTRNAPQKSTKHPIAGWHSTWSA